MAKDLRNQSLTETAAKPEDIMDVNQSAVVDEFNKTNARVMIHGHTHRPGIHRIELNDSDTAYRIVLGDWANGPSAAVLNDNVISLSYGDCREELVLTQ
jgi:UDP-2,3-diacylglucosamine hydrolase